MEEVAREGNSQEVANILWAYAKMGRKPGERALREVEGWAEEVAREGNSEAVRVMRRALGALDTKAAVLSAGFGVREGALHVGGSYQNRGISLLDQLGGGGAPTYHHSHPSWCRRRVTSRQVGWRRGSPQQQQRKRDSGQLPGGKPLARIQQPISLSKQLTRAFQRVLDACTGEGVHGLEIEEQDQCTREALRPTATVTFPKEAL